MAVRRNINYITKDFNEYRNQLINYSQVYFPQVYTDFTPSSPGMMFMEQAAYVGDVLSFYLDNQINSEYLDFSIKRNSMIISNNVVYNNSENILKADVVEIDIQTKDTKIFMYEDTKKVNIKSKN